MIKPIFLSSILFLFGCAVALVPESNDPKTKIAQATELFNNQGRPIGAAMLLKQAIELSKEQGDKLSEANAEFYLAEIYKSPGPRGAKIKDPKQALVHYNNTIKNFNDLKYYKRAAFASWNESGVYETLGKTNESCNSLKRAKKLHAKNGANPKDGIEFYSDEQFLTSVQHYLKKYRCK